MGARQGTGIGIGRVRRAMAAGAAAGMLATSLAAPVHAATPTTVWLTTDPFDPVVGTPFNVVVHVTPTPSPTPSTCGEVDVFEDVDGTAVPVMEVPICNTETVLSSRPNDTYHAGVHTFFATFTPWDETYEPSESEPLVFEIAQLPTSTGLQLIVEDQPSEGRPVTLAAYVQANLADTGSVEIYRDGEDTPDVTCSVETNHLTPCTAPAQTEGWHSYVGVFLGTVDLEGSTGNPLNVFVGPNELSFNKLPDLEFSTFYPVKDDYRDTVGIRGNRDEPMDVNIKIYSPGGALIKTADLEGDGPYSYGWDGRKSDGSIRPEGKYKVVQTLTDGSLSQSFTDYVNLSKKKLVRYSKTIKKSGSNRDAVGLLGAADVDFGSGFAKIHAAPDTFSFAGVGWQFSIPDASIYESVVIKILARRSGGPGANELSAQNFDRCAYTSKWKTNCFDEVSNIPATSGTTRYVYKSTNLGSEYRAGRKVRALVSTTGGTIWVYEVSVVVKYGILRY